MAETDFEQSGEVYVVYGYAGGESTLLIYPLGISPMMYRVSGELTCRETNVSRVAEVLENLLSDNPTLFPAWVKGRGVKGLKEEELADPHCRMYQAPGSDAVNRLIALEAEGIEVFQRAARLES